MSFEIQCKVKHGKGWKGKTIVIDAVSREDAMQQVYAMHPHGECRIIDICRIKESVS